MEKLLNPDELIILCGGNSSRLGTPKGLVSVEGRPWLAHQLAAAEAAGLRRVIIVLGHHREEYLAAQPWHGFEDLLVELVTNPRPERGQFSSLLCGLEAASGAVFVLPVDVPCPAPAIWRALSDAFRGTIKAVLPERGGRGGHPILLSGEFAHELRDVELDAPDARLDAKMHELPPEEVVRVAVADERVTANLNTAQDWAESLKEPRGKVG